MNLSELSEAEQTSLIFGQLGGLWNQAVEAKGSGQPFEMSSLRDRLQRVIDLIDQFAIQETRQ